MRTSNAKLAVVAALATAMAFPALARDTSGGGRPGGGHTAHAVAPHFSGAHGAAPRHFHTSPRVIVYIAVPVVATFYASPGYYPYPLAYAASEPAPAYWYYCAAYKDYFPRVRQCPVPWQPVIAQPPPPGWYYPG